MERSSHTLTVKNKHVQVGPEIVLNSSKLARSLKVCHTVHVFLATLGSKVDQFIDRTMCHRPAFGVVVDAVASVATESMVDLLAEGLSKRLQPGEALSMPFSPGHCDWPIEEQRKIFSLLPECPAGTTLSADSMMSPRKSVSGILGEGLESEVEATGNPCAACPRADCSHRRSPYERK
jgi:hypothetical protein